jgi:predicted nuclease of predicted toxin-antitoxin system
VGLDNAADEAVFAWAQSQRAVVITFDEDFADSRWFTVKSHHGIIRLRIWPTTIEETQSALGRLLDQVPEEELEGALIIIGKQHIRIRRMRKPQP